MRGSAVTNGWHAKRLSFKRSGTTHSFSLMIACAQNEMPRAVSVIVVPTRDLNHRRSESISVMSAIGVSQIWDASKVRLSKISSGGVSRISKSCSSATRCRSFFGIGTWNGLSAAHFTRIDLPRARLDRVGCFGGFFMTTYDQEGLRRSPGLADPPSNIGDVRKPLPPPQ